MADTGGQPEITGSVLFFKRPEPLSNERHGRLGVKRSTAPLAFAREAHVVPVTVGEFAAAALSYPIIFAGDKKSPLVVMGLRAGANLFINDEGVLDADMYLPAFIRRYPFVFAQQNPELGENSGYVVCVDAGSDLVTDTPDMPFFENGKPTDFTNEAIEFLTNFEKQRVTTERLVSVLEEHDLFEEKTVNFQPRNADGSLGDPMKVADYYAVSTEKLNKLSPDALVSLRDSAALNAIYIHNVSLLNWKRVIDRAMRQQTPQPATV